jgi:CRP-like cAMP-binding protein
MKRPFIKPIDEATSYLWRSDVVTALNKMEQVPEQMGTDLMKMLRPHYKPKGHLLLDPDMKHKDAIFLRTGLIKLYLIHPVSGKEQILHVWIEGEIVVLYKMFRRGLKNTKYYIETIENSELVSISIDHMDIIYGTYPVADRLTTEILSEKNERRIKQLEILGTVDKGCRPAMLEDMFPEFCHRLNNADRCAFIGVAESTLGRGNH